MQPKIITVKGASGKKSGISVVGGKAVIQGASPSAMWVDEITPGLSDGIKQSMQTSGLLGYFSNYEMDSVSSLGMHLDTYREHRIKEAKKQSTTFKNNINNRKRRKR